MKSFLLIGKRRFQKLNIASKEGPCGPVDGQTYNLTLLSILYFNSEFQFLLSILFMLHVVLLQFPIPRGFSNSHRERRGQFIAGSFA